jgi:hypothetical protein
VYHSRPNGRGIGNQIDAAFIFARTDFISVHRNDSGSRNIASIRWLNLMLLINRVVIPIADTAGNIILTIISDFWIKMRPNVTGFTDGTLFDSFGSLPLDDLHEVSHDSAARMNRN